MQVQLWKFASHRISLLKIVKHIIIVSLPCKLLIILCIKYNLSLMVNAFGVHANHSLSLVKRVCCNLLMDFVFKSLERETVT